MILGIDQGTTGTTVILFDTDGNPISNAYNEFTQYFPKPGWVEHDPLEILDMTYSTINECVEKSSHTFNDIKSIGLTNQRETTVVWNKHTGKPVSNAIVWQCRRTADLCDQLKEKGHAEFFHQKTGLVLDAYFSGTKIKWILDSDSSIRQAAINGDLCFGTIDTWLIWNFSNGKHFVTDHTNASRTLIYNIHNQEWDQECLDLLDIPKSMLPTLINSVNHQVKTDKANFFNSEIPIHGIVGDQQAALFGQQCVKEGMIKNTYGTGCFMLMYTGQNAILSSNGLLTTIACDVEGKPAYALEGSVFIGGAVIQWIRDQLGLISTAQETEEIATSISSSEGVYVVPSFVGLGAPHWNMEARGLITGLTRGSSSKHIIRAALESIALQSMDVFHVMSEESGLSISELRVDGGASANNFLMQLQADLMQINVNRPRIKETTVFGAALLAGLGVGFWSSSDLSNIRKTEQKFEYETTISQEFISGWHQAVQKAIFTT